MLQQTHFLSPFGCFEIKGSELGISVSAHWRPAKEWIIYGYYMDKKLRFDFTTTQKIINKIGFIDSFKGKWTNLETQESNQ